MIHYELEWKAADGNRMYGCEWTPEPGTPIKGVVGIVHGMGEHTGRYAHVASMLAADGWAVLAFDQRGHGRTEGKRGHVPAYDALLEGVDWLLQQAAARYPALPRFLFGHSMGGNVAINYLLRRQPELAGAIITGPWLKLAFQPPKLAVVVGRIVEKVYPGFSNARPLAVQNLTTDPEMAKRYIEDPLGHGNITAAFFFGVQRAGLWALAHASELRVPMLLMHGGDDKVTSLPASKQFAERAGELCEFMAWPGFKHELHNERGRGEVFASMLLWLNARLIAWSE